MPAQAGREMTEMANRGETPGRKARELRLFRYARPAAT